MKITTLFLTAILAISLVSCNSDPIVPSEHDWLTERVNSFLAENGNATPVHPGTNMTADEAREYLAYLLTDWDVNDPCEIHDRLIAAMATDSTVAEVMYLLETPRHNHWDVPRTWEPQKLPCD